MDLDKLEAGITTLVARGHTLESAYKVLFELTLIYGDLKNVIDNLHLLLQAQEDLK